MFTQKEETSVSQQNPQYSLSRYLIMGGALGLYFGWFFRPLRETSYPFAIALSVVIMLVMVAFRFIPRTRPPARQLLPYAASTFIKYACVLLVLEFRHPIHDMGGRLAVTAMTTIMGVIAGWWYARKGTIF